MIVQFVLLIGHHDDGALNRIEPDDDLVEVLLQDEPRLEVVEEKPPDAGSKNDHSLEGNIDPL